MDELSRGERQRREVNSYNLFLSSLSGRSSPSLGRNGVSPLIFPEISSRSGDVTGRPDFLLYNGEDCVLAEIKSGNNIDGRDVKQMKDFSQIDIEGVEKTLDAAQISNDTPYDGNVKTLDQIIVYQDLDEEYIEEATAESDAFGETVDTITDHAVLMTQDYGGSLRVLSGDFDKGGRLQSLLEGGIRLPQNPDDKIMLTEGMEPEILSIAITDIWGNKALDHDGGITVTRTEVRNHFAPERNVDIGDLDLVFEFLVQFGACDRVENHTYEFTPGHMNSILEVESQVMDQPVDDYLHGPEQARLGEDF